MKSRNSTLKTALACAAIGWMCWSAGNVCNAQDSANPPGLSPDLQEVVKLSQARMTDDVIKNYIASTGKSYRLSADDIIYLNGQGVSAGVINALQTAGPANNYNPPPAMPAPTTPPPAMPSQPAPVPQPSPAPAAYGNMPPPPDAAPAQVVAQPTPPPPPQVGFQYFHDQLAPFGTWISVNGVTYWRPDQALAVNPDWRPYYDMGQWVQTDNGLYWQSDYTWGDIPFHYGRWVLYPGMGWLWAPDYVWGPAWVFWRQDEEDAAIGWAPLPVGAVFVNGGFMYNGVAVGLDFDFGLGFGCFTFVGYDHFHEGFFRMRGHEWAYNIDHARLRSFYGRSVIRNDFHRDDHGRFVNDGIGRDRVERLTHVEHASFEERGPVGDRNHLAPSHNDASHNGASHNEVSHNEAPDNHGEQAHGQPGNFGGNHSAGPGGESNASHTQTSGSASKVFRPPTSGGSSQKDRH
jgi:hypothetical protein